MAQAARCGSHSAVLYAHLTHAHACVGTLPMVATVLQRSADPIVQEQAQQLVHAARIEK